MCNGTEGKKTAVWGWWGALGNLATAPIGGDTPYPWDHMAAQTHKGPHQCTFFFTKVRRKKYTVSSQIQDHRTEVRRTKNHFIVMVVLAAFLKYTQNCQSISKRSALVAKQFFSRCFFSNGTENPLLIGRCHMYQRNMEIPNSDYTHFLWGPSHGPWVR